MGAEVKYNEEDLLSHHGIAAIIRDSKNKVLMQKHVKYGFWTIPVGKVKKNQPLMEGLKEELFEECNIKVKKAKEIANRKMVYERNRKEVVVDSHLFLIEEFLGEVTNSEPDKHSEIKFMSIDEIKKLKNISDMTLLYLETIGEPLPKSYLAKFI